MEDAVTAPARPFHTLMVAQCSREGAECSLAHANAPPGPTYVVAFGTGAGSTRSRAQAMADLYRELRDRTASGSHLAVRPRHLAESEGGAPAAEDTDTRAAASAGGDPLVEASFELMKIVDRDGEITLDSAPSNASCKVALVEASPLDASAGVDRCLQAEERHQGRPSGGRGIPW
jgi:hypothetical protein